MDETVKEIKAADATPGFGPAPRRRAKWPLLVLLVIALAISIPLGWHEYVRLTTTTTTDDATIDGNVIAISSRVSGTVTALEFKDNERVQPGQVLIRLDPQDYQVALLQAEAALELARRQSGTAKAGVGLSAAQSGAALTQAQGGLTAAGTSVTIARAGVDAAQSSLESSKAKLAQARAQLDLATVNLERARALTAAGVAPRQNLDQAETAYKVAQASVQAAEQDVAVQQTRLDQANLAVKTALAQQTQSVGAAQGAQATQQQVAVQSRQYETSLAQVKVAEAALDAAKLQLSYTTITAPAAGRLGDRAVELGQRVTPGQPLVALVQDGMWVTANYKETQITHVKPGQPVEIRVDTFPGKVFKGYVDSLSPASGAVFSLLPPENASGNFTKIVQRFPIRIDFDPGTTAGYEDRLVPGMSVVVTIKVR